MSNETKSLIVKILAYVGVPAFIYCASPLFLPWDYVTAEYIEGYTEVMSWMSFVFGASLLVLGFIGIIRYSRPRVEPDFRFGIILWGVVGYILALFLFCLPTIFMHFYGVLTVVQAQIIGAVLSCFGVMLVYRIFAACYTEREREDSLRLPKRPKLPPPPEGAEKNVDKAMRGFVYKGL